jgi:hypothetical protein
MIRKHHASDGTLTNQYYCDFCDYIRADNKGSRGIVPVMECDACTRHVCSGHRKLYKMPWVGRRKWVYCLECWEIGKKYRDRMMNQAWKVQNDLRLEWHCEAWQNRTRNVVTANKTRRDLLMIMTMD